MNKLFCLLGESSCGKNVILEEVLKQAKEQNIKLEQCTSCTTRLPRTGEVDGIDYKFVTIHQFDTDYKNEEIAEWNAYRIDNIKQIWIYYTRISDINLTDKSLIKPINPTGYSQLKSQYNDELVSIWITCPKEIRRQRYIQRGALVDNVDDRLKRDERDFKYLVTDYEVLNDGSRSVEEVAKEVLEIIKDEVM